MEGRCLIVPLLLCHLLSIIHFSSCLVRVRRVDTEYQGFIDELVFNLEEDGQLLRQIRATRANATAKPTESLFSADFGLHALDTDTHGAPVLVAEKKPNTSEIVEIEKSIFVDPKTHTVVRLNEKGEAAGIVGGRGMGTGDFDGTTTIVSDDHNGIGDRPLDNLNDVVDLHRDYHPLKGRSLGGIPKADPELFVVLDYETSLTFNHDSKLVIDYLTVFFKAVNDRYDTLKAKMRVSFKVSQLLLVKSYEAQPFIDKSIMKDGTNSKYDTSIMLDEFQKWVFTYRKSNPKSNFDIAILLTSKDIYGANIPSREDPKILKPSQLAGLGSLAGACLTDESRSMYYGGVVTKDVGGKWDGVSTAAHELAHNLGSNHDGKSDPSGKADSVACPWDDGYVMSYQGSGKKNKFFFSTCSVAAMKGFIASDGARCIKLTEDVNALAAGTSRIPTMSELCVKYTNTTKAKVYKAAKPTEICLQLYCVYPNPANTSVSFVFTKPGAIVDGMVCNEKEGKVCINGECVVPPPPPPPEAPSSSGGSGGGAASGSSGGGGGGGGAPSPSLPGRRPSGLVHTVALPKRGKPSHRRPFEYKPLRIKANKKKNYRKIAKPASPPLRTRTHHA